MSNPPPIPSAPAASPLSETAAIHEDREDVVRRHILGVPKEKRAAQRDQGEASVGVRITGVDMGIGEIAQLLVKVSLAILPAAIIVAVIGLAIFLVGGVLLGILGAASK